MSNKKEMTFSEFLSFFPEIEPPIQLSNAAIADISSRNKVFPLDAIVQFFSKWEENIDEFTEFVPCCILPKEEGYYALIYWKASLLNHHFKLLTLEDRSQTLVDLKVIAGTISDGISVMQSVASISEDLSIQIVVGKAEKDDYDPMQSNAYYMEIQPGGLLFSQKEDKPLSWLNEEKNSNPKN